MRGSGMMADERAERHFREGVAALKGGNPVEAVAQFEAAIEADQVPDDVQNRSRYLSYYGLSLALAHRPSDYAIRACAKAVAADPLDPTFRHNLVTVYLLAGKTSKALANVERGLRLAPTNSRLKAHLANLDRRKTPAIPRLSRDHPLNRWLGRLRASVEAPR